MSDNPYEAPVAEVRDYKTEFSVPDEVLKKIKHAWIAAIFSGLITLIVTLFAIFGHSILGFTAWELGDVILIFGLAYGIYRRSRTCAVIMLLYFIASKILIMYQTGTANGPVMAIVFIYYYWQGVVGTFAFHKISESLKNDSTPYSGDD